jgi:hypothetical protein
MNYGLIPVGPKDSYGGFKLGSKQTKYNVASCRDATLCFKNKKTSPAHPQARTPPYANAKGYAKLGQKISQSRNVISKRFQVQDLMGYSRLMTKAFFEEF